MPCLWRSRYHGVSAFFWKPVSSLLSIYIPIYPHVSVKILSHGILRIEPDFRAVWGHRALARGHRWIFFRPQCTLVRSYGFTAKSLTASPQLWERRWSRNGKDVTIREKRQTSSIPEPCAHFHLHVFLKAFPLEPVRKIQACLQGNITMASAGLVTT